MRTKQKHDRTNLLARITLVAATTYIVLSSIQPGAADTPPLAPSPTTTVHATAPTVPDDAGTTPTTVDTTPADVTSAHEPAVAPFVPTSEDIDMAVAVLTRPDNRTTTTGTHRWVGPTVTYNINLPGYDPTFLTEIDATILFIEQATGIDWVWSDNPQITILAADHNGGRVHARPDSNGYLQSATIWLGCCRARVAWEELTQVMGAFGDHTDSRSVFSNNHDRTRAGAWEAWLLNALYQMPAGSDTTTIRNTLTAQN